MPEGGRGATVHGQKQEFLLKMALDNSVISAMGRGKRRYVQLSHYQGTEGEYNEARAQLTARLRQLLEQANEEYEYPVSEDRHCDIIEEIANTLSREFLAILSGGRFRIGIAQKALNLYLKFKWCLCKIPPPPHCPFDRRIIDAVRRNCQYEGPSFTEMETIEEYRSLVEAAKCVAGHKPLPYWELEEWDP